MEQPQKHSNKSVYLSLAFAIIVICAVLFMFYKFSQIPDDAQQCLNNPLEYTENKIFEQKGKVVKCTCEVALTTGGNYPLKLLE